MPYGLNTLDQIAQTSSLRNSFVNYLIEKRAAGIVNVSVANVSDHLYLIIANQTKLSYYSALIQMIACISRWKGSLRRAHIPAVRFHMEHFAHANARHDQASRRLHSLTCRNNNKLDDIARRTPHTYTRWNHCDNNNNNFIILIFFFYYFCIAVVLQKKISLSISFFSRL